MSDYPRGMTLRPIEAWPHPLTKNRRQASFSAPWSSTLTQLDAELRHLGRGRETAPAVLQIAMREQDFRLDGMPRANAVPSHPGVILSIESTKGPLSFPCDTFDRWRDNLRAITLTLEKLRAIDRYGVTKGTEQYTGWQQLPAGGSTPAESVSAVDAERVIRRYAAAGDGVDGLSLGTLSQEYRRARAATHPDRGGPREAWDAVEAAAEVLRSAGRL